jgi:hypothetical protein
MATSHSKNRLPNPLGAEEKFSFSFYRLEQKRLEEFIDVMSGFDIKLDRTKVVRALVRSTPEIDLVAHAVLQFRADTAKEGPRESDYIAERFTVILPVAEMAKLRRVVGELEAKGVKMNLSYVLRSLLRAVKPTAALVPVFKKYHAEFPDGRSRAARVRKA